MTGLSKLASFAIPTWAKLAIPGVLLLALGFTWQWGSRGWERAGKYEAKLSEVAAVQTLQNERLEQWARDIEESKKRIAVNAQKRYEAGVAVGNAAAERHIASHRVQPAKDRDYAIRAPSIATPVDTGLPENATADPVVVEADDVRICTALYQYALAAHEYALDVVK